MQKTWLKRDWKAQQKSNLALNHSYLPVVCVCVCVWGRERELECVCVRERECACAIERKVINE